jgi:predicted AAA+ superfamily ATPase
LVKTSLKEKQLFCWVRDKLGKTTLVKSIIKSTNIETLWLSGDDYLVRQELGKHSLSHLKSIIGRHKMLVIDEAQYIDNIGLTIKIIVDNIPDIQVIATGSSAFELANALNEPLTGRKFEYMLYPVSYNELVNHNGLIAEKGLLEHRLVYGSYPEIASSPGEEKELLQLIASSYLYKDLFIHQQIKKPQLIEKLTKSIGFTGVFPKFRTTNLPK